MFDTEHILEDGAATKIATGYGEVDSQAAIANLGDGLVRGNVIVDVSQLAMGNNDQYVQLHLLGGSDGSFTKEVCLAVTELGAREAIEDNLDSKLGRYVLPFQNERNGVIYPYVRVRHVLGGTNPSINYQARLEKNLETTGFVSTATTTTTT